MAGIGSSSPRDPARDEAAADLSCWPDMDSEPLSLKESWRLHVASAQVYSIVRNRDMEHFDRVINFLEAIYKLHPRIVAPIKHMKILFGLKTMVIMWILKVGRGKVDTVFKINQFFPSKLPQYQDQCSQYDMFLMRKNHMDFKALAQGLAMDKDKLKDYIKNLMEEQYGEHYAQKVEERLLHYLCELETVLPGDTFTYKILKKESPVTEEERELLEVINSDSMTIATTLMKLRHCDVAPCHLGKIPQASAQGKHATVQSSKTVQYGSLSKALLQSVEAKAPVKSEVSQKEQEVDPDVSQVSPPMLENGNNSAIRTHCDVVKRPEEDSNDKEKEELSQRVSQSVQQGSSPQFCSKHKRWVKTILQECPEQRSEELLFQANVSSPLLFQSSSSISSSQDLTPSDLIPNLTDQQHPLSQNFTHLQTVVQASEHTQHDDEQSSGSESSTSQMEHLSQQSPSRDTLLPALAPMVRVTGIASVRGVYTAFKPHQAYSDDLTTSSNKWATSADNAKVLSCSHCHMSEKNAISEEMTKDSTAEQSEMQKVQAASLSQDISTSVNCQPPSWTSVSRFSRKFRQDCLHSSTVTSSTPNSNCLTVSSDTSRVLRAKLRLSQPSQAVLLQSKLFQSYVILTRLSVLECYQMTEGRSSNRYVEPSVQSSSYDNDEDSKKEEEDDADLSFDPNILYSSHSSSRGTEDLLDCDPDYKHCIKKKKLLLEYEITRR